MSFHEKTTDAAKGKWRGILMEVGVNPEFLTGKHCACPLCGGTDRFRFDNREGSGSWICNQCGAGSGMDLAMRITGQSFPDMASRIDGLLGNKKIGTDAPSRKMSAEDQRTALRKVYGASRQAEAGDLVDAYLRTRDLDEATYPPSIRFAPSIQDGEGGIRPAMIAVVSDVDGKPATLHRTFLRPDGKGKAEGMGPKVRKLMPGDFPDGGCVRLAGWASGPLGIAEGIETAMAARNYWDMPVWAALNAGALAKWTPPEGCDEVAIFADHDVHFAGQAAAFRLANRLAIDGKTVTVHIPDIPGEDWADVWVTWGVSSLRRATSGKGRS